MTLFLVCIIFISFLLISYILNPFKNKKKFVGVSFFFISFSLIFYFNKTDKEVFTYFEEIEKDIENNNNVDPQKIIIFLEKKLSENPNNLDGWLILARTCLLTGHIQKAELYYYKAMKLFPENLELIIEMAILKKNFGQNDKALEFLYKAKLINPNDYQIRKLIIDILLIQEHKKKLIYEISEIKNLDLITAQMLEIKEIENKAKILEINPR